MTIFPKISVFSFDYEFLFSFQGKADVSQDDFSGPEAEHRYRSLQAHMPQVEHFMTEPQPEPEPVPNLESEPEVNLELALEPEIDLELELEPETDPEMEFEHRIESFPLEKTNEPLAVVNPHPLDNGSFRMRPRKQSEPLRAPFF